MADEAPEKPAEKKPRTGGADGDGGAAAKAKGKAKAKAKVANPDKPIVEKDTAFEELWQKSLQLRKQYLTTIASAMEIDNQISTSPAWDWAMNEKNQGQLTLLAERCRQDMSAFHRAFLAEEPTTTRKRHTPATITVELTEFHKKAKSVSQLSDCVKQLQRRHVA